MKSSILADTGTMRLKQQANGIPKVQGVFAMKDREGFPIDMSYELAKENGWEVDWVECLADAMRQSPDKFKAVKAEIEMLDPDRLEDSLRVLLCGLGGSPGTNITDKAKSLHARMWAA
jgi:alanyl-tRNA synthetase